MADIREFRWTVVSTLWSLLVCGWMLFKVSSAPRRYSVKNPNAVVSCAVENQMEQLPMIMIPMWMCAAFVDDMFAAFIGLMWTMLRIGYFLADPQTSRRSALLKFTIPAYCMQMVLLATLVYALFTTW